MVENKRSYYAVSDFSLSLFTLDVAFIFKE